MNDKTLEEKIQKIKDRCTDIHGRRFANLLDLVPMKTWETVLKGVTYGSISYDFVDSLFDNKIDLGIVSLSQHENSPEIEGKLKVSVGSLVSRYYDKPIKVEYGLNKPSLMKQLTKQGIKPTEKEWKVIKELETIIKCFKDTAYLELDSFELDHNEQDIWALAGSCNQTSETGENTWEYLEHNGFNLLRMYDQHGYPVSRVLFYREGNEFAHAGCYSDMVYHGLSGEPSINHTAYPLATMLLAIVCERKLDDVVKIRGFDGLHNDRGVWANMNEQAGYSKYGTKEKLLSSLYMKTPDNLRVVYSDYLEEYIQEDEAIYVDNISDYISSDHEDLYLCNNCDTYFVNDSYSYDNGVFPARTGESFCDIYCFHAYYEV